MTLPPEGDGLLRERDVCAILAIGRSTLWRWAAAGILKPVHLSGSLTRWHVRDVRRMLLQEP